MKEKALDILHFLRNFNSDQLYWYYEFGKSKRKISVDELKKNLHMIDRPVFFLSTGRTGTQWFARLFSSAQGLKAYHAPSPDLAAQNCFAYKIQKQGLFKKEASQEILSHIFLAGREQYLRYSYKCLRRYVETNNHITFFAYTIADLLPQAKFIHIHRHPGDFVSSGLKRKWFLNGRSDNRQILPVDHSFDPTWSSFNTIQKISWLWNETNAFIETFKNTIPNERIHTLDFSSMDIDSLHELIAFSEVEVSEKRLKSQITRRVNVQRFSEAERYNNWPEKDKEDLAKMCNPLATRYGYSL